MTIAAELIGEKLPARVVTDRLVRIHNAILKATARHLGGSGDTWPVQITEPNIEDMDSLSRLHELCDWVIMTDRNIGIEYFDSPRDAEAVFEAYVINAVPERDDLGCLQLITSTAHFDEVRTLLDETLSLMGLSASARNCKFILDQLKGLSGRLAMRLATGAGPETAAKIAAELVALALVRKKTLDASDKDPCWPSLRTGFFVPLDDIRDILPAPLRGTAGENATAQTDMGRADLLYVVIPTGRARLAFRFIEVKYRRHLNLARHPDLQQQIVHQTEHTRRAWMDWFFDKKLSESQRVLRVTRLARILRFYGEKARRHHLDQDIYDQFLSELNRLLATPGEYELHEITQPDRGLIFCPDFHATTAERLDNNQSEMCQVWLFGPDTLPDAPPKLVPISLTSPARAPGREAPANIASGTTPEQEPARQKAAPVTEPTACAATPNRKSSPVRDPKVIIGTDRAEQPVCWTPTIQGNPHLMVVGLPGMGKTTCLINICRQLHAGGITPVVFSYHDDIDEKLKQFLPDVACHDCRNLGFNPMRILDPKPLAHVEAAGMLRDIFSAIFPDLGDLQREQLRTAIKKSYEAVGWSNDRVAEEVPAFRDFLKRLHASPEQDNRTKTLLARLTELDDYGFFIAAHGEASLLEVTTPQLLRIHAVSNEAVQRAYASFVLYRIYQDMFRRGRQEQLTHAVIFDEAHRASRLKLLPTMAKECRKYGIALIVASQEARDFDTSLFSTIANYLVLRVTDADARAMARNIAPSEQERRIIDRLKNLPKFEALFFAEGQRQPITLRLAAPD